jgi:hypothetical protein
MGLKNKNMPSTKSKSLPWDVVEKAIAKEVKWLKEALLESPYKEKNEILDLCRNCIYRRIAILIISGNIKAKEIKSITSLWGEKGLVPFGKPHGKEWHNEMMKLLESYFRALGYKVIIEPNLNIGRADLGAFKENERNLYIEVGTISLPKLLFNFESMENSDFLLVIDEDRAIEFSVIKAGYKYHSI